MNDMVIETIVRTILPPALYNLLLMIVNMIMLEVLPENMPVETPVILITSFIAAVLFGVMLRWDRQKKAGRSDQKEPCCSPANMKLLFLLLLGAAYSAAAAYVMHRIGFYEVFSNETQEAMFGAPTWMLVLGPGVLAPVAEELCYRGLLYGRLRSIINVFWAAVLSSLAFAVGHGNPIQMLYAFPSAVILAWIYEKYGCINAPICFHLGANLLSILVTIWRR